jgi:hypothetical protein
MKRQTKMEKEHESKAMKKAMHHKKEAHEHESKGMKKAMHHMKKGK